MSYYYFAPKGGRPRLNSKTDVSGFPTVFRDVFVHKPTPMRFNGLLHWRVRAAEKEGHRHWNGWVTRDEDVIYKFDENILLQEIMAARWREKRKKKP